ncbi:MAG: hypothetical protein C4287_01710 [Leptolyngbya sp. ERB_1_2]
MRDLEPKARFPFATIVTKDYGDFETLLRNGAAFVVRSGLGFDCAQPAKRWKFELSRNAAIRDKPQRT